MRRLTCTGAKKNKKTARFIRPKGRLDAAHGLGGRSEEMAAAFPVLHLGC
jgi:hypothetical protein